MDKIKYILPFKTPVSIVMIVYNEGNHIKSLIEEYYSEIFLNLAKGSEYIIYLDKPTDNTPEIVKKLSKRIDLRVIEGEKNLGYAKALKKALLCAKKDVIFYSDSSGKHNAMDFWKLIKFEDKYDIISGLRIPHSYSMIRRIITFVQRIIVSILFVIPFYDFNAGFKIIHKNIVNNALKDCKYMNQNISTEMLIRAHKKGYTIKNVPIKFIGRTGKNTGTNFKGIPSIILKSIIGFFKLRMELLHSSSKKSIR